MTSCQHDIFLPTINLEHDLDKINQHNPVVGTDISGIQSRDNTDDNIEVDQTYVPEVREEQKENDGQNLRRSKRGHIPSWKYLARYDDKE